MKYIRADKLNFDPRGQLAHVFVEGFYAWVKFFCRDREKLKRVFAHVFILEYFFVAVADKKIAAMAACTNGFSPIKLERAEFVKIFGIFRGNLAFFMLRRHMVRNSYPFSMDKNSGSIEFVATAPEFLRQGVARALISYVMAETPCDAYILEVADTNTAALRLYESLGFAEITRAKAPRGSGVGFFIYMRRTD